MEQTESSDVEQKPRRHFVLRYAVKTDVGQRRGENQDAYGYSRTPEATLFIVADGMGGARGGATASTVAVNVISREAFEENGSITKESLGAAVEKSNALVFAFGNREEEFSGMGTTVVALAVVKDQVYIAFVGDSRIYHCRDQEINQLSRDHTLVQELVDSGSLEATEAINHPIGHMLTRSLGPMASVQVDVEVLDQKLKIDDKLLLCCDGLYNHVEPSEICTILRENDPDAASVKLIDLANERGGTDNITVQIIEIVDQLETPPESGVVFDLVCSGTANEVGLDVDFDDIDGILKQFAAEARDSAEDERVEQSLDVGVNWVEVQSEFGLDESIEQDACNDSVSGIDASDEVVEGTDKEKDSGSALDAIIFSETPTQEDIDKHEREFSKDKVLNDEIGKESVIDSDEDAAAHQLDLDSEVFDGEVRKFQYAVVVVGLMVLVLGSVTIALYNPKLSDKLAKVRVASQSSSLSAVNVIPPGAFSVDTSSVETSVSEASSSSVQIVSVSTERGWPVASVLSGQTDSSSGVVEIRPTVSDLQQNSLSRGQSEDDNKVEEMIRVATDLALDVSTDPEHSLSTDSAASKKTPKPIKWSDEAQQIEKIKSQVLDSTQRWPGSEQSPLRHKLITRGEKKALIDKKAKNRSNIADIDIKLKVFDFRSKEEAKEAIDKLKEELGTITAAVRKTRRGLKKAKKNISIWQDRKSAFNNRTKDFIVLAEEVAWADNEVDNYISEHEIARQKYMASIAAVKIDPNRASEMSALGREFQHLRVKLEASLSKAIVKSLDKSKEKAIKEKLVLEDLKTQRSRINRNIGLLKTYSAHQSPSRRMLKQRELYNERRVLVRKLDGLRRQLSDNEEHAARMELAKGSSAK